MSNLTRIQQVREFLAQQRADRPLLIVSPSRALSEELARPQAATFGWHRLSWGQLLERLSGKRCLPRLSRWAVVQQAIRQTPAGRYAALRPFPGFALCLERTISDLRMHEVSLGADYADLDRLASGYESSLGELSDESDLLDLALRSVEQDRWLGSMQALVLLELTPQCERERRLLEKLRERIANFCQPIANVAPSTASRRVASAPDESLECQNLARFLLQAAGSGVRWEQMAILLRQPERYRWCLEATLRRADIPAYFSESARQPHPTGRALLCLLQCAREGASAQRFAEYLSLGELPREVYLDDELREEEPGRAELATPYRWEELLGAASVIRGPERWHRRLQGLVEQRKSQMAQLRRDDADSPRIDRYQAEIEQIERLDQFALPLVERLSRWTAARTWGEWLVEIEALARQALAYPDAVIEKLRDLAPVSSLPDVKLDEVIATLAPELSQIFVGNRGHRYGKVFIGALEEARGRSFEVVLVPGMAERRFPPIIHEDPLLGDDIRRSYRLPTRQDSIDRERETLESVVGCAQRELVFSYSRNDQETGRPLLPSSYLMELMDSFSPSELMAQAAREGALTSAWPAHPDPEQAIDWQEHSLSWLRRLRAEGKDGSANFMFDSSPFLRRAMRSRMRRGLPQWTHSDGCVGLSTPNERLRPSQRPYSPSALERFAGCPYRFWLYSGYGLSPREVPEALEEMDPLTRGSFFHDLHARLVWRGRGEDVPLSVQLEWLEEESAAVAARYADAQFPLVPRVFADEVKQLTQELAEWLKRNFSEQWTAVHAELAFQLPEDLGRDPASSKQPALLGAGFTMRGSIDRVERSRQGKLRVIDFKTGKEKVRGEFLLGKGEALQPVLYALAVRSFLQAEVTEARLEYSTLRGGFKSNSLTRINEAGPVMLEALGKLEEAALAGHFPAYPNPRGGSCKYCDYQSVCGPRVESFTRSKPSGPPTRVAEWWRDQL